MKSTVIEFMPCEDIPLESKRRIASVTPGHPLWPAELNAAIYLALASFS
jgi:hypothetical protein